MRDWGRPAHKYSVHQEQLMHINWSDR